MIKIACKSNKKDKSCTSDNLLSVFGKHISLLLGTVVSVVLASSHTYASDLLDLSLKELMQVKVYAASKREELADFAPGVISIISHKEIKRYGARHLADIIDRVAGVMTLGSHFSRNSKTSLRGLNQSHPDNTTLFLINGRPTRDGMSGGYNSDLYRSFPIDIIERIEIIRGPSSVLYGTNAVSGVINIVTFAPSQRDNEVALQGGSFGQHGIETSLLGYVKELGYTLGYKAVKSDGDTYHNLTDEFLNQGDYSTGEDKHSLFVDAVWKDLKVSFLQTDATMDAASSAFVLPSLYVNIQRRFIDINYTHKLNEQWTLNTYLTNTHHQLDLFVDGVVKNPSTEDEHLVEMNLSGELSDKVHLIGGLTRTRISGEFSTGLPYKEAWRSSAFTQFDFAATRDIKLIAGIQYNSADESESSLSPRLGYIQELSGDWKIKLMYGEAFRSPYAIELFVDARTLKGNPNLLPEEIETFDTQLIYQSMKNRFTVALFKSRFSQAIVRMTDGDVPQYGNLGFVKFQGVELENQHRITHQLNVLSNFSVVDSESNPGVDDNSFSPKYMLKAGLDYGVGDSFTLGLFFNHVKDFPDLTETYGNPDLNPKARDYTLLDLNVVKQLNRWSTDKVFPEITVYLTNLLDEDIFIPDLNHRGRNNTFPHGEGVGGMVEFSVRFH